MADSGLNVEKRRKNKNWTVEQTTVLVERCVDGYNLLTGAHKLGLSESDKDSYWAETIEMINAVGPERSLVEAKRKWIEVKILTKKKTQDMAKERRATGGGPAPGKLNAWEEKTLTVIPSCSMSGVNEHGDVFLMNSIALQFEDDAPEDAEQCIKEKNEVEEVSTGHTGEQEHKPITCKQGQKPISGEQGPKPITGEHGKKPILGEQGQKRKYESKCFVYLIKNNNY
ncbi:hypothetical protein DPMN_179582 [Dreissena polymorpha]|uniref:Myb/SANT-like DNA-binding domain-containing protein n=1 Tax=Dreissena polymorpha TaxID=45954 RepID=A0A9D4IMA9_DREPO|nr:hypothetical protein DPMN_179582 [Dreissena polymorpha]